MTEKIGTVRNPLTIIAIFAGIAEVSGTIVLPFVSQFNQILFIYFLITFPSILVILFFITLNFNNKALYAPSDYKNEDNYVRMFKFDMQKQTNVELKISKEESIINSYQELKSQLNLIAEKITTIEFKSNLQTFKKNDNVEIISDYYEIQVTPFENVSSFIKFMAKNSIVITVYEPSFEKNIDNSFNKHAAIWLGTNVTFELAKKIVKLSKSFYPHLKYIHLSGDSSSDQDAPRSIYDSVYIGGATSTALEYELSPLSTNDFENLDKSEDLTQFHEMIRSHY